MNKLARYAVILLLSQFWDLFTTRLCTPDLSREMNPVTVIFGFQWTGTILFQLVLFIITLLIVKRSIKVDITLLPTLPGLTPLQVISWVAFGDLRSKWNLLWSFGATTDRKWYYFSGVLLFTEPIAHLIAGIHNIALTYITSYIIWTRTNSVIKASIGIIIVVLIGFVAFILREFNAYRLIKDRS